ncbi:uncharacterized protein APUU_12198S [Aspergillus puulaauensis]|uniref:Uncharacterized protein n=1 Tax=Aspergillus puulaauensis TaxID=1220207 RepID=A0A7R7XDK7_9EURO|nr:uncharacterized protein APUU_12198S [Aspergillus puulaauensis]BCS19370.1 hypothetical protein APUU_12198S [Aspergillus puulaauensis]
MDLGCRFSTKQPWSRKKDTENGHHDSSASEPRRELSFYTSATTMTAATGSGQPSPSTSASASAPAGFEDSGCISTTVLQKQVASGNDALNILFDAAAQAGSGTRAPQTTVSADTASPFDVRSEENVLKVWEGCRFVKMGWFTAEEALLYTDWLVDHPSTLEVLRWVVVFV